MKTKTAAPNTTTTTATPLVRSKVIADHLSVTPRYVQLLAEAGKIPCIKISGRCLRFDFAAVMQALKGGAA